MHNLSRRAVADLRIKPHGHWDRLRTSLLLPFVLFRECRKNSTFFRSLCTLIVRFFTEWRNYYCYRWHPRQWNIIGGGGGGVVVVVGSRSMTKGYNRLELLYATEVGNENRVQSETVAGFLWQCQRHKHSAWRAADLVEAQSICRYLGHEHESFNASICL
jgi:hypothetical protein